MTEKDTHESTDDASAKSDGGPASDPSSSSSELSSDGGMVSGAAQRHRDTDYLDQEINLLKPSTPFMRDHLKLVWVSFVAWVLATWGPVTATFLAPETMTSLTIIGFPAHYLLVALFAPTSSLVLAAVYAHRRDKLDQKYGIDTSSPDTSAGASNEAAATDGGVDE